MADEKIEDKADQRADRRVTVEELTRGWPRDRDAVSGAKLPDVGRTVAETEQRTAFDRAVFNRPEGGNEIDYPEPILRYFEYAHLPAKLAETSAMFSDLAWSIVNTQPRTAERSTCLRKLLEAKDCAVRNVL